MTQQQPMTNEQFALYIASAKFSLSRDVVNVAEIYYDWLESKRNRSGYDIMAAMESTLEKEKERAYDQGHIDGYNEALEANDNPFNK
jgi:hypothetical protein